jgi:hypothetical protein
VDAVRLFPFGFRLVGVHAALDAIPDAQAHAAEVRVETKGLRPTLVGVAGAELTLDHAWGSIENALAAWRAAIAREDTAALLPWPIVSKDLHIVWRNALGDGVHLDAHSGQASLGWRGSAIELHVRSDDLIVVLPDGRLGPWRVDLDLVPGQSQGVGSSRLRVAFDPAVPDACTLLIVGDAERTTSLELSVPRTPLARLGIPARLFGDDAANLQVRAALRYESLSPSRANADASGGLYGLAVPEMSRSLDGVWEGTARGAPAVGLDVKAARLAVGPLVGTVSGSIKEFADGVRFELAWQAAPISCDSVQAPLDPAFPFDVDFQLRKYALQLQKSASSRDRVQGGPGLRPAALLAARGALTFDTRDLAATKVTFSADPPCPPQPSSSAIRR